MRTGLDHEIKPSAVTMAPGLPDGFDLASRQLVQLSFSHLRPTIRPTFEHGSRRIPTDFREGLATSIEGL
jgi:hypothetical protein